MENKKQQPIQPQSPVQPESFEPVKNPLPKWPFVVVVLILTFVLIGGAYLLGQKSNSKIACTMEAKICPDGSSVGRTGPKCEFSPCPKTQTTTPDKTASWKTYTDPNGIYSLKYPATWKNPDDINPYPKESGNPINIVSGKIDRFFRIIVRNYEGFGSFTAKQFVTDYFYVYFKDASGNALDPELKFLSLQEKTINGNKVTIIKGLQTVIGRRGPAAWLTHEDKGVFIETTSLGGPEEKDQATLEQILSAFKFTQ